MLTSLDLHYRNRKNGGFKSASAFNFVLLSRKNIDKIVKEVAADIDKNDCW